MASRFHRIVKEGNLHAPSWFVDNLHYEVMMGSVAYGASNDTSDMDIYGWVMPPLGDIFPHINGHIAGFGHPPSVFENWQQHHVKGQSDGTEYDFAFYSIVKFVDLCMQNNPNMLDALFVPDRCVLHSTKISQHIREHRKAFLHKGCYQKLKGYAYSQIRKLDGGANRSNPKRQESIDKYSWDIKFGYHVVRLVDECEQILTTHDLDITRGREMFKSIRRGEWTLDRLKQWFEEKEKALEHINANSTLRQVPDVDFIKKLLLECIEMHYGSVDKYVVIDKQGALLQELKGLVERYGR